MPGLRQRIKTALETVPDVVAFDSEPGSKVPMCAWPVLRSVVPGKSLRDPLANTYDVFLILPNASQELAAQKAEELLPQIVAALSDIGEWVPPADTVQIQFDNTTTIPGLRVQVIPDAE